MSSENENLFYEIVYFELFIYKGTMSVSLKCFKMFKIFQFIRSINIPNLENDFIILFYLKPKGM